MRPVGGAASAPATVTAQFMLLEYCAAGTLAERVSGWNYPVPWSKGAPFAADMIAAIEVGRRGDSG